jgi:MFS family permease
MFVRREETGPGRTPSHLPADCGVAPGQHQADAGAVITAGLAGAAVAAVLATIAGDRLGGRRSLMLLAALAFAGGVALMGPLKGGTGPCGAGSGGHVRGRPSP